MVWQIKFTIIYRRQAHTSFFKTSIGPRSIDLTRSWSTEVDTIQTWTLFHTIWRWNSYHIKNQIPTCRKENRFQFDGWWWIYHTIYYLYYYRLTVRSPTSKNLKIMCGLFLSIKKSQFKKKGLLTNCNIAGISI